MRLAAGVLEPRPLALALDVSHVGGHIFVRLVHNVPICARVILDLRGVAQSRIAKGHTASLAAVRSYLVITLDVRAIAHRAFG
jgi:hypothetical protein